MKNYASIRGRAQAQTGFTLIEILIVVGIIAVIMGIVAGQVFGQGDRAKANLARTQIQLLAGKIESYELDNGQPPQRLEDLVRQPSGSNTWLGPYAREQDLRDPWNRQFEYRVPGSNGGKYELVSYGADGRPGGDSYARDIIHEG